jgi:predicted  nucleic acid-binding Zn-ribbon protein
MAKGLEALGTADSGALAELEQALEEEKTVNAQLSERIRVLSDRQKQALAKLEERAAGAETRMGKLDLDLQRLRRANAQLTSACDALREANEAGVGDAHLINRAMMAELEALRAARTADQAEAEEIIARLMPLIDGAGSDSSNEEAV